MTNINGAICKKKYMPLMSKSCAEKNCDELNE
jgi:hypothetical protein